MKHWITLLSVANGKIQVSVSAQDERRRPLALHDTPRNTPVKEKCGQGKGAKRQEGQRKGKGHQLAGLNFHELFKKCHCEVSMRKPRTLLVIASANNHTLVRPPSARAGIIVPVLPHGTSHMTIAVVLFKIPTEPELMLIRRLICRVAAW